MKHKIKAVLFDLDGTILDTLDDLCDSVNFALESLGLPQREKKEIRLFLGNGIKSLIQKACPNDVDEETFEKTFAAFKERYAKNMENKTKPFDGICDIINLLRQKGYKTAVVSNKYDEGVKNLCAKYFKGLFDCVIGESEGVNRKPAPDMVFKALEQLGETAQTAVFIGDSEVDMRTAKNAGVTSVGVLWGFRDKDVIEKEGANRIAQTPADIIDIIESL